MFGTPQIVGSLSFVSMLSAINFYYRPRLEAAEVGEKVVYRMVAPKFGTTKSAAVKKPPQLSLGIGLVAAQ